MLRITATIKDRPCTIQDPFPPQGFVKNFTPNAVESFDVQWDQLERLAPQLNALVAQDFLTYIVATTDGPSVTEQSDSPGNPSLDYAEPGVITAVSLSLVLTGNKLLGNQVVAEHTIPGDTVAGSVLVEAVNPGGQGNDIDVEVVDTLGGGLTVAVNVVDGRQVITIDLGGSAAETCTTVAALINNPASATYGLVQATAVDAGATAIATIRALAPLTGGVGSGMSITLAGLPCTVVSIDQSGAPTIAITVATPALGPLGLATGDKLKLELRSDGKYTDVTLNHA
jgi:hypothetical protein